jgi:2,5-diketo-D-gluconate reductase A
MTNMFQLPQVGLGTWRLAGSEAAQVVHTAIGLGYRHIDTATAYCIEEHVGHGIAASQISRDQLTIVTKFPEELAGCERAVLHRSLKALQTDYLDLWLLHGPASHADRTSAIWQHFISAHDEGLVREIGVSNFNIEQIDELIERTNATPAVNQIAFGPYYFESTLQSDHLQRGVTVVAHSPFNENDLDDSVLNNIAQRHQSGVHQVILSWHAAHHVPVIAKSRCSQRLEQNLRYAQMTLTADEVAAIDATGIDG